MVNNRLKQIAKSPKLRAGLLGISAYLMLAPLLILLGFRVFDRVNPPPLDALLPVSVEVLDRNGDLLRAYTTPTGRWRLKAKLEDIDSEFLDLLLSYEDKRFWHHGGIDPLAMLRASWQLLSNGRIISGASTITMQLARLIEPRDERTFSAKLLQMMRALQLEERLSKEDILTHYLTLAPYGGNLEGIRAASLAYFSKEPKSLTLSEASLLVALPQSPVSRRPDVFPKRALAARNMVLRRLADAGAINKGEVDRAALKPLEGKRHDLPQLSAHLADRLIRETQPGHTHSTTLNKAIQQRLETAVADAADRIAPTLSIALILADAKSGEIVAEIGSPDYVSAARSGWIDMTRAMRSPGSALKPFIYGLALEEGLVREATLITDGPIDFSGYRPKNFDMDYQGEVSIRDALLLSLNVPAVALLDAVGPARLMERLRRGDIYAELPDDGDPGLAIGLGGVGITLLDLTQLYTIFVNGGYVQPLYDNPLSKPQTKRRAPVLDPVAAWRVADILLDARPPKGMSQQALAYKTGTSYGYRDAWSVGFDGRYVMGVWVGKTDNSAVPGITGWSTAAPILFEAFSKAGLEPTPLSAAPFGASHQTWGDLPPTLRHFQVRRNRLKDPSLPEPAPQISYPPSGAEIEVQSQANGKMLPIVVKLQDGRPPFRWLANGDVFSANRNRRTINWQPDGLGQSTLTVIDANGRADSVSVFLRQQQ